jgi:hypothetical protein
VKEILITGHGSDQDSVGALIWDDGRVQNNEYKGFEQTGRRIKSTYMKKPDRTPVCEQGTQLQVWGGGIFYFLLPTVQI